MFAAYGFGQGFFGQGPLHIGGAVLHRQGFVSFGANHVRFESWPCQSAFTSFAGNRVRISTWSVF